ncbi:tetraspanin-9-like [Cloeon dipterum]|uniref:tetraspanin-9-like n=1 Tax=Cloeon dipterum TaxID=197152 RepID=UPI00321FF9A6
MKALPKSVPLALCVVLSACAIIEIVIGAVAFGTMYSLEIFEPLENRAALIVLMTSGVLTLICSAIGIVGFMKNRKLLLVYIAVACASIILQVAGFSVAFHSNVISEAAGLLVRLRVLYDFNEPTVVRLWDDMQKSLQCCGFVDPSEWNSYPDSCCLDGDCTAQTVFSDSCLTVTEFYFFDLTQGVAGLSAAMTILQLILGGIAVIASRQNSSSVSKPDSN